MEEDHRQQPHSFMQNMTSRFTGLSAMQSTFQDIPSQLHNLSSSLLRPQKASDLLPIDYEPTALDVCSGRGKRNWNHSGNVAFRKLIQNTTDAYMAAPTKYGKTVIVSQIVEDMRKEGCKFLKQQGKTKRWFDIGDVQARDKVGHSLRDQVTAYNRQTKKKEVKQDQHVPVRRPSITLSDSGNDVEVRRSALESTALYTKFARRPSWIAGENNNSTEMDGIPAPQGFEMDRKLSSWEFLDDVDHAIENGIDSSCAIITNNHEVYEDSAGLTTEEQTPVLMDHQRALLRSSIQSWDPRSSNPNASSSIISVHRSGRSSGVSRGSMRSSGSSTLRRMTNSLRMSEMSMMSDMIGGIDFNVSSTSDMDVAL